MGVISFFSRIREWVSKVLPAKWDIAIVIGLGGLVWYTATWKTSIEKDLKQVKEEIQDIRTNGASPAGIRDQNGDQATHEKCLGTVGIIDTTARNKRRSSYGARYLTGYNICEVNESSPQWEKIGFIPYLGHFVEIENTQNGLKSWCMVIGSFDDEKHPNRVLLVSQEVAKLVNFKQPKGILPVRFRVVKESEWREEKPCIDLYESVYKLRVP